VEPPTFTTGDPVPQEEGSIVVDGLITLHELNELHSITLPHSFYYSTLAGFVLDKLGSIPQVGDHLDHEGLRFTVMEMDRNRIKLLKISKLQSE
jgi:CBS domain containing-hemolysin-like protein